VRPWSRFLVLLAGSVVLSALPFLLFWSQLPEPMAGHWGFDGRPDGDVDRWTLLAVVIGLAVFAGGGLALLTSRPHAGGRAPTPGGVGASGFLFATAVGIGWSSVLANRGAARWQDAADLTWGIAVVLATSAVVGFCCRQWERRANPPTRSPESEVATRST
jgi:hypothetical protein